MAFKLGKQSRDYNIPGKTNLFKKEMDSDTLAQANMDGSIDVDPSIDLNSAFGKRVIKHEQAHIDQINEGRAAYGDNWVMWEGNIYIRKNGYIDGPNGRFPEGHPNHPWESEAIKAEKQ